MAADAIQRRGGTDHQSEQGRGDGQTCAASNISFYINTNMFICHFLYRGWLQMYIIQTRMIGICDVEIDGNSVVYVFVSQIHNFSGGSGNLSIFIKLVHFIFDIP
jgi:hypothetical protein